MQTENTYVETDLGNIAFNPRGEYSDETPYEYLDTVSYKGGSYVCLAELAKTTSGIAPEPGKNTEMWQLLTLPGDMTPEYIAIRDEVVEKAEQVESSRAAVELSRQEIEDAQADVQQMRLDAQEAAEQATASRDSAAGYAQSAEASRTAAAESEQNINAQVTGFDTHVAEKTSAAETAITEARRAAVSAVSTKQDNATQAVTDEGDKQIKNVEDAGTEQVGKVKSAGASAVSAAGAAGVSAVNAVKTQQAASIKAVADEGTQQVTAVNTAGSTQASIIETKGADQVKVIQEAGENALQNISDGVDKGLSEEGKAADAKATGEAISNLTEDLSIKITKFYASNQGETHIADSDNGKIQDMMIYGKSSQDGTPTPENPVEIKSVVNPTIKLIGSNVLKIMDGEYQQNGVTATVSNGVIKLKGTANAYQDFDLTRNLKMFFEEGTEIIFSPNKIKGIESQNNCYLDFSNNNTKGFSIANNNINAPYIIKKEDTKYPFELYIRCSKGTTLDEIWKPQVLIGKTITAFKPYTEQTITLPIILNAIPVSSGGNVTINGQRYIADYVDVERGKVVRIVDSSKLDNTQSIIDKSEWLLSEQQETDLTTEQTQALKELVTYYPVTNININSEQLDGYTVFNYPVSMANGWNYVKQQLNDNRDYIYDMDLQSAEAYVNSEYAVALTELEV